MTGSASQIGLAPSIRYGLSFLLVLARYLLHRGGLRRSRLFVASGAHPA